ncbi:MAG: helix-turn-helix domain-containing protein [Candidatus Bathyarchaeia archaeon]
MPISEETRKTLREIGLNTYEVDAYIALLEEGQMTAMEISRKAKVPYSKIYEVLNSLRNKGWIKRVEARPTKYHPVAPLDAMANARLKFEEKYRSWEQKIAGELQLLYERQELVERPDILILHGQKAVMAKLEETVRKASREIMVAVPEFAKDIVSSSATLLQEALNKANVEVKVMVSEKVVDEKLRKLACFLDLRARDHMFGGGIIVDGKEAMLFLGEEKPSLVIWSNHAGLVRFAREYFQFLWDSSKRV